VQRGGQRQDARDTLTQPLPPRQERGASDCAAKRLGYSDQPAGVGILAYVMIRLVAMGPQVQEVSGRGRHCAEQWHLVEIGRPPGWYCFVGRRHVVVGRLLGDLDDLGAQRMDQQDLAVWQQHRPYAAVEQRAVSWQQIENRGQAG